MENVVFLVLIVLVLIVLGALFLVFKKISQLGKDESSGNAVLVLQEQLNQLRESLDRKMNETRNVLDQKIGRKFQDF